MLVRLGIMLALMSGLAFSAQEKDVPDFCNSGTAMLSPRQVKIMLRTKERIQAPCCGDQLRLSGTVG